MAPIRHPVFAGRFYPADPQELSALVQSYLNPTPKARAIGCVVPHAGYIFSGHVAGEVFSRLEIPARVILLCPNHTGRGTALSIMSEGAWETPLGPVQIDSDLALKLKQSFKLLSEDSDAHRSEHAAEVELPFLQILRPDVRFVPIAIGTRHYEVLQALGLVIAKLAGIDDILIIASSDMNHYESDAITRIKDHKAIEKILALDALGLYETVLAENISMCGLGPTVVMLSAAQKLGASHAELVKYATSGDISADRALVVGYAGIIAAKN